MQSFCFFVTILEVMKKLLPVLIVLFLGYLGFSLALPIFPPLFLDLERSFLPLEVSTNMRRILIGLLFSAYPLGQFIGAPIMGKLSDKYGRKPILLLSLLSIIPGYIGSALSIIYAYPPLLFFSRFWVGLLEGNITIAYAAIADISENEESKVKNFGWMVSLSSSAFFFGPLIGGFLADSKVATWFRYDTPFWFGALFVLIGFLTVWIAFKETRTRNQTIKISLVAVLSSFLESLKIKRLKRILAANLCFFLALFFFLNFFTSYFLTLFHFNVFQLGKVSAYLALLIVIAPFSFGMIARFWTALKTAKIGLFCTGVSLLLFLTIASPHAWLLTLIPLGFLVAVGLTYPALMISNVIGKRNQGQALGANVAIQVFGEAITALVGGFLAIFWIGMPILFGALFAFLGGGILLSETRNSDLKSV